MKFISFFLVIFSVSLLAQQQVELRKTPVSRHGDYIKELLELAYAGLDYKIQYVDVPGVREIPMAVKSKLGGVLARDIIIESDAPELEKVQVPLFSYQVVLLANISECGTCEENKLAIVAYPRGGKIYKHHVDNLPERINTVAIGAIDNVVKLLEKGRVDAVIMSNMSVSSELLNNPNIKIKVLETRSDFHYLSPKNKELKAPLEKALNDLVKSGKVQELKKKYGIE